MTAAAFRRLGPNGDRPHNPSPESIPATIPHRCREPLFENDDRAAGGRWSSAQQLNAAFAEPSDSPTSSSATQPRRQRRRCGLRLRGSISALVEIEADALDPTRRCPPC